jgi:hypothetical protein
MPSPFPPLPPVQTGLGILPNKPVSDEHWNQRQRIRERTGKVVIRTSGWHEEDGDKAVACHLPGVRRLGARSISVVLPLLPLLLLAPLRSKLPLRIGRCSKYLNRLLMRAPNRQSACAALVGNS